MEGEKTNNLFRMNFIIQDNYATTFDTNLVQIIEAAIYESSTLSLTYFELQEKIRELCGLTFSLDELKTAVRRKGRGNLVVDGEKLSLTPEHRFSLSVRPSFDEELRKYAQMAIEELQISTSADRLSALLTEYLYYCFNSNKDTLLSLINNRPLGGRISFERDNAEIGLINQFLDWDNDEKNRFIYNAVSYCYVYCTLTVKKDVTRSRNLFLGKTFILDANIIFRMAGINNDFRKFETAAFIDKCREVGIKLYYTDRTLDEIYRVIQAKVIWIKAITRHQQPLDLRPYDPEKDDFYCLYYDWARDKANQYDDYAGFQQYLIKLIREVLSGVDTINTPDFRTDNGQLFNEYKTRLGEYKSTHSGKAQSEESLATDVNNIMFIQKERGRQSRNMWSTQEYLISADQNLIAWVQEIDPGIPLAVLPSTWLTVILRFSGRSNDDYRTFCSFLRLRTHVRPGAIDVYQLVGRLSEKTSSDDLKMRIVQEVFDHQDKYDITDDNGYEKTALKAFDVVISQITDNDKEKINELENQIRENKEKAEQEITKRLEEQALKEQAENEKKLDILINEDEKRYFRVVGALGIAFHVIILTVYVFLIIVFVMAVFRMGLIYHLLVDTLDRLDLAEPEILISIISLLMTTLVTTVPLPAIVRSTFNFVRKLRTKEEHEKYRRKRREHYEKIFNAPSRQETGENHL